MLQQHRLLRGAVCRSRAFACLFSYASRRRNSRQIYDVCLLVARSQTLTRCVTQKKRNSTSEKTHSKFTHVRYFRWLWTLARRRIQHKKITALDLQQRCLPVVADFTDLFNVQLNRKSTSCKSIFGILTILSQRRMKLAFKKVFLVNVLRRGFRYITTRMKVRLTNLHMKFPCLKSFTTDLHM